MPLTYSISGAICDACGKKITAKLYVFPGTDDGDIEDITFCSVECGSKYPLTEYDSIQAFYEYWQDDAVKQ
jgi:hypothetical protein